jgi:hypothetical protein
MSSAATAFLRNRNSLADYLLGLDRLSLNEIHYSTFVDPVHKLIYVETPKCACSSIKSLLLEWCGRDEPMFFPTAPETKISMHVHVRNQLPLRSLVNIGTENPNWANDLSGWFCFALVRHPVERLFSAWRDKVFLVEPGFEEYHRRLGQGRRYVDWQDFADWILANEDLSHCNRHWRLQTRILDVTRYLPFRIYRMTAIDTLVADLGAHMSDLPASFKGVELPRINEGLSFRLADFVSIELAKRIETAYAADMNSFGFRSYRGLESIPPLTAGKIQSSMTDGIFERNRTIACHVRAHRQVKQQTKSVAQ